MPKLSSERRRKMRLKGNQFCIAAGKNITSVNDSSPGNKVSSDNNAIDLSILVPGTNAIEDNSVDGHNAARISGRENNLNETATTYSSTVSYSKLKNYAIFSNELGESGKSTHFNLFESTRLGLIWKYLNIYFHC